MTRSLSSALFLACPILLAACGTPPVYYADPTEGKTATISVGRAAIFTSVVTQDDEGCVMRHPLGNRYHARDARKTALVSAGKPVLMSYNYSMGKYSCDISYVFFAEAGEKYSITAGSEYRKNPDANALQRTLGNDKYEVCTIHVVHETDAGALVEPVYPYQLEVAPRSAAAIAAGKPKTCLKASEPWATLAK